MKIVSLEVENLMRIKAARVEPDGSLVIVGGDNDQGKTSLLNAIEYALAGKRGVAGKPVREGTDKARIVVDLENLKVTRTFTEGGGGTLVVRGADGEKLQSPQKLLDRLTTKLTFDPLAFLSLKPGEQATTLLELIGVDLSKIENEQVELTSKRRDAGVVLKQADATNTHANDNFLRLAEAAGLKLEAVQDDRVDPGDIQKRLEEARQHNWRNAAISQEYNTTRVAYADALKEEERAKEAITEAERVLDAARLRLDDVKGEKKRLSAKGVMAKRKMEERKVIDESAIVAEFSSVQAVNEAVTAKQSAIQARMSLENAKAVYADLDRRVKAIPDRKRKLISMARMPIPHLGYEDGVVTYNGQPFDQAGTGSQIRVSVAMGVAMKPELKVFLVRRDGSLLDDKNLALLAKLADEYDCQVWMERVSKGEECSVIIEDGEVVETDDTEPLIGDCVDPFATCNSCLEQFQTREMLSGEKYGYSFLCRDCLKLLDTGKGVLNESKG